MLTGCFSGAFYIELEEGEFAETRPVELGENSLKVGDTIPFLGREDKKRASFRMQEGWQLRFQGWFGNYILFDTVNTKGIGRQANLFEEAARRIYYAFAWIDSTTLFVHTQNGQAGYDIRF